MLATALEVTYSLAQPESQNVGIGPTGTAKNRPVSARLSPPLGARRRQGPFSKRPPHQ